MYTVKLTLNELCIAQLIASLRKDEIRKDMEIDKKYGLKSSIDEDETLDGLINALINARSEA